MVLWPGQPARAPSAESAPVHSAKGKVGVPALRHGEMGFVQERAGDQRPARFLKRNVRFILESLAFAWGEHQRSQERL